MRLFALLFAFGLLVVLGTTAWAQAPYDDLSTPEGWAWRRIQGNKIANFDVKCKKKFDPHQHDDWDNACRKISPQFLVDIVTRRKLRDQIGQRGVHLIGALVTGTVDLAEADTKSEVWLANSRIEGDLKLTDSRWSRPLVLEDSIVTGGVSAERLQSESAIFLDNHSAVGGVVNLRSTKINGNVYFQTSSFLGNDSSVSLNLYGANIGGDLELETSTLAHKLDANSLTVGGNMFLSGSAIFSEAVNLERLNVGGSLFMSARTIFGGELDLTNARVGSNLEMETSSFAKPVWANGVRVGHYLLMKEHARFEGEVNLVGAEIGGDLSFVGSYFKKRINAYRVSVAGDLDMSGSATFSGDVILRNATVRNNLSLETSAFSEEVNLNRVNVGGSLFMRARAIFGGEVDLTNAAVGSNLEMETSFFAKPVWANGLRVGHYLLMNENARFEGEVDLVGAEIGGNLSFHGSYFKKTMDAYRVSVAGDLDMRGSATFSGDVILGNATVRNNLSVETSTFSEKVNLNRVNVGGSLFMGAGAIFGGEVNLTNATVGSNLEMDTSYFAKTVWANGLKVGQILYMDGQATFGGDVHLSWAEVSGNLYMDQKTSFHGYLKLEGTRVKGGLQMETSIFLGKVYADSLNVSKDILMDDRTQFFDDIDLDSAKVAGFIEMQDHSNFESVSAISIEVGQDLRMDGHTIFDRNVDLSNAKIEGNLWMDASAFTRAVSADSLRIGRDLMIRKAHFGGNVDLNSAEIGGGIYADGSFFARTLRLFGARIGGDLELSHSSFSENVDGARLVVNGNILMRNGATILGKLILVGAKIGELVRLSQSNAAHIDLSGAEARELFVDLGWWCVGGDLPTGIKTPRTSVANVLSVRWRLGDPGWAEAQCTAGQEGLPTLNLSNAHVDTFRDTADGWPARMGLEGFHYERLGGSPIHGQSDMLERSPEDWADWLRRDPISVQPYTQLSNVLLAAGKRDAADAILVDARERERCEACKHWNSAGSCAWLITLSYVAGYGIGLYTFVALAWVVGFTQLGADVLWYSEPARRKGYLWRIVASLDRLLPIMGLGKEFSDFFDNPAPESDNEPNLSRGQILYFAGHAIAGWVLGLFLLAAMGGIIQRS